MMTRSWIRLVSRCCWTTVLILAHPVILLAGGQGNSQTTLCHLPPGNPDNAQTLHVSQSAVQAHLDHGDYLGPCTDEPDSGDSDEIAELIKPVPGSVLEGTTLTFEWTAGGEEVTEYWLRIGSVPGGGDLLDAGMDNGLSAEVTDLPDDGSTLYVTLSSRIGADWFAESYEFTAYSGEGPGGPARLTSHQNGDALSGSTVTFTWEDSPEATQYYIWIGSTAGDYDVYLEDQGTALSATISGLPTDGSTLYLRLWSRIDGVWEYTDTTLHAAIAAQPSGAAVLVSHQTGDTLSGATVTFTWDPGLEATQYFIWIGSSAGTYDLYLEDQGTHLSATISGLPINGSTLYFRLWSRIDGVWEYNDYSFAAASGDDGGGAAALTSHQSGDTLSGSSVTFTWEDSPVATQYYIWIGSVLEGYDIALEDQGLALSTTISGLPADGSTLYFRLWSKIDGLWESNDYVFHAASAP